MAKKSLPRIARLANIALKRGSKKPFQSLSSSALNKLFPQFGRSKKNVSSGSASSNSNDATSQIYNNSFNQILQNQNKQNEILDEILEQIKGPNNFFSDITELFNGRTNFQKRPPPEIDTTVRPPGNAGQPPRPAVADTTVRPPGNVDQPPRPAVADTTVRPAGTDTTIRPFAASQSVLPPDVMARIQASPALTALRTAPPSVLPPEVASRIAASPVLRTAPPLVLPPDVMARIQASPALTALRTAPPLVLSPDVASRIPTVDIPRSIDTTDASRAPTTNLSNKPDTFVQRSTAGAGRNAFLGAGVGSATALATGQPVAGAAIAGAESAVTTTILSQAAEQTIRRSAVAFIGRTISTKFPLAGLLAGLYFSGERAIAGDWIGSGLELTSGVAGTLGVITFGLGTTASVGIDVLLLTRDVYQALYGKYPENEVDTSLRDANLAAIGPAITKALNELISRAPAPQNLELNEGTRGQLARLFQAAQGDSEDAQVIRDIIGGDQAIAGLIGLLQINLGSDPRNDTPMQRRARAGIEAALRKLEPLITHRRSPSARMIEIPVTPSVPEITPKSDDSGAGDETGGSGDDLTPNAVFKEEIIKNNNFNFTDKNSIIPLSIKEFKKINFEASLIKFQSTDLQSKLNGLDATQNPGGIGNNFFSLGNITTGDGHATNGSAARALEFFQSKGWTLAQAAGIVANLDIETAGTFNPGAIGDGGKAYGIAQWHPDRQAHFQSWAGRSIRGSTFEQQLEFVQYELTEGREKKAGNRIRQTATPQDAAIATDRFYERSSGAARTRRIRRAITLAENASRDATQINQEPSPGDGGGNQQPQIPSSTTGGGNALSQANNTNPRTSTDNKDSVEPVASTPSSGTNLAQAGTDMVVGDQRQALSSGQSQIVQSQPQQQESPQSNNRREQLAADDISLRIRLQSTLSYA